MPRKRGIFSEEERIWERFQGDPNDRRAKQLHRRFQAWRREWKRRGPVEFAVHVLQIDPETGKPLLLSDDQREFLLDITVRDIALAIISAGRGSGKTFVLAIYIMWRIFTHDKYQMACMGGSTEQSDIIQQYMRGWKRNSPDLKSFTWKDIQGEYRTFAQSSCRFVACSPTSTRGKHVREVIIDEQAAGEEAGGEKYIRAFTWQASTSEDLKIIRSSTPHYVHGDFLKIWNDYKKLGYKRYRWAVARHNSGELDPYLIYEDSNPYNWFSNVPWSSDKTIQMLRRNKSNEEWLAEALGAFSRASGLVFNPLDITACVCSRCLDIGQPCKPFKEEHCPVIQYYMQLEGLPEKQIPLSTRKALMKVKQRVMGIDWGHVAPDAYCVVGKFRNTAFVLHQMETTGQNDEEKIQVATEFGKTWGTEILRPDPREWAYNNELANIGFAVHELFAFEGGSEKKEYIHTLKKFVERHLLVIPVAFEDLIRSLMNLSYDDKGRIRKKDDHSFDSLLYALSYYGEVMDNPLLNLPKSKRQGVKLWQNKDVKKQPKPHPETRRDFFGDNKKKKKKKQEDENPWRGVKLW